MAVFLAATILVAMVTKFVTKVTRLKVEKFFTSKHSFSPKRSSMVMGFIMRYGNLDEKLSLEGWRGWAQDRRN